MGFVAELDIKAESKYTLLMVEPDSIVPLKVNVLSLVIKSPLVPESELIAVTATVGPVVSITSVLAVEADEV